ncbi:MAG: hypothetical protein IPL31_17025 [Saprospiraceae bacterium]|nr:hypothetical protein [Saprospiraceae bacterium]
MNIKWRPPAGLILDWGSKKPDMFLLAALPVNENFQIWLVGHFSDLKPTECLKLNITEVIEPFEMHAQLSYMLDNSPFTRESVNRRICNISIKNPIPQNG